ncbi:transglutaminase-like superfamily protein [Clostridium acetireducens DSM 10703]|uniref:Transglutaminase-like superfamily protein n=1 Tax=Clostridium acetireducens DSM 10703 TaxID=1121290 RepID=A0A1E8EYP7_9CLOT|nr:transglutaminase-like domain-containing protein [Clostridium acetireducens]OFI06108.1 transglutaminase-like superfamily protein [Clostridium acetireducens DSM 10703]
MKLNPITIILLLSFIYPLLKGFLFKFSSHDLKYDIEELGKNISFIAGIVLGTYYGRKIFIQHYGGVYKKIYNSIPYSILKYIESNNFVIYLIIIPILIIITYKIVFLILQLMNLITIYPILDNIESFLSRKSEVFKRVAGALFQIPKALCYLLIITFLFNLVSILNGSKALDKYLETSKPYKYICKEVVIPITNSRIAKKLPNIIDNSFKVVIKNSNNQNDKVSYNNKGRTIVYYNGVTLDEGIKSNSKIDKFAKSIVSNEVSTRNKAKILYNWIGSNISYDNEKADKVLNNDFNVRSGAVATFETRKGICFDYSCLYVSMCRANGIKVRLITGYGFNGLTWVNHAWNQVYIPEESQWINVDTTFYKGGNYFDSRRFKIDHKNGTIAGEW